MLLAEDNELNREIAGEIIGMTGAEVESAENGKAAVDTMSCSTADFYGKQGRRDGACIFLTKF